MKNLCVELGDVLFQVMLNSQIAAEQGAFTIEDVVDGICRKMVRRHPLYLALPWNRETLCGIR